MFQARETRMYECVSTRTIDQRFVGIVVKAKKPKESGDFVRLRDPIIYSDHFPIQYGSNIPVSSSLAYSPLQWMSQKCVLVAQLAENETGNHVWRWRIVVQPHNSFELC